MASVSKHITVYEKRPQRGPWRSKNTVKLECMRMAEHSGVGGYSEMLSDLRYLEVRDSGTRDRK